MLYGGRISLAVGLAAMLVAVVVGMLVGALAGMSAGGVDAALMWLTDLFLSLPQLPLLLLVIYLFRDALKAVFGPEGGVFVHDRRRDRRACAGCRWRGWCGRSSCRLREKEFVEAARALGASTAAAGGAPHPAERARAGDRRRHDRRRRRDHRRIDPVVPRPRLPAGHPDLGPRAVRRQGLPRHRAALGAVPGRGDLPRRARRSTSSATGCATRSIRAGSCDAMAEPLLDIRGLKTWFKTDDGMVRAVDGVSLSIGRGETAGRGRRVRLRQDGHGAQRAEADRHAAGPLRGRPDPVAGPRPDPARRRRRWTRSARARSAWCSRSR